MPGDRSHAPKERTASAAAFARCRSCFPSVREGTCLASGAQMIPVGGTSNASTNLRRGQVWWHHEGVPKLAAPRMLPMRTWRLGRLKEVWSVLYVQPRVSFQLQLQSCIRPSRSPGLQHMSTIGGVWPSAPVCLLRLNQTRSIRECDVHGGRWNRRATQAWLGCHARLPAARAYNEA